MAKKKSAKKPTPTKVESVRHQDKRKNIPTEELRNFVRAEDQHAPPKLYPRDPSLDPQLVWRGKDEQDAADLAAPVVPIYIQEKIHPQAIIDDLPRIARGGDEQLDLFADFNGLPAEFDQRVDFYQHDGHWSNRMILGDSLLVMTSLAEKEGLAGQVQTIYLDPPYGIKFGSNWQVSTRKRDVKDGKTTDATRQPEQVRAFRDTWQLGIHSYLAYLRDRLVAARELLTDSGSVFVQIGDENVHLVRSVMDEVFGPGCEVVTIVVKKKSSQRSSFMDPICDYVLWYTKTPRDAETGAIKATVRKLYQSRPNPEEDPDDFTLIEIDGKLASVAKLKSPDGEMRDYRRLPSRALSDYPGSRLVRSDPLTSGGERTNQSLPFAWKGVTRKPKAGNSWKHTAIPVGNDKQSGMERLAFADRLIQTPTSWRYKRYWTDFEYKELSHLWDDTGGAANPVYVVQTNESIIERCILMTTDPGDLVLDPTCGSGTTAYVAERWGRRWITCDTSRVALALARTRLMAAKFPYYYLADDYPTLATAAGDDEIKSYLRKNPPPQPSPPGGGSQSVSQGGSDVRKGFVYKRAKHITSSSIANTPDIREGMTRAEIDAAIARHAETETLFDQPYEDKKRVRVSGPFTVESLSPHRSMSVEGRKDLTIDFDGPRPAKIIGPDRFGQMIIDNLRKAGVQNTVKGERLKFDSLEPYPGEWIHAVGTYTEHPGTEYGSTEYGRSGDGSSGHSDSAMKASSAGESGTGYPSTEYRGTEYSGTGKSRRAAVCIGPEFGTVEPALVKEAAKEAVRGVGFDVLIVCGFAFDPHVSEEAKRYGNLFVLPCRMNPDLAMGDELLKKTGAGNLFMVFGEPDIVIRPVPGASVLSTSVPGTPTADLIEIEIRGLDVYDPTTGEIRSNTTDEIACWFIDANYNGESFFVRHAYFTGADEPYEKLKRALKAEIDEDAWAGLYSTTSRPFPKPETGKFAVKVINHYGDEVLKVYAI